MPQLQSTIASRSHFVLDDTKLIGAMNGKSSVKLLQEDLNTVMEWSRMNNMQVHGEKLEVIGYPLNTSKSL